MEINMISTTLAGNPSVPIASDPEIAHGAVLLYYFYEVAEGVDLSHLQELVGPESAKALLTLKHSAPQYLQFQIPPVVIAGDQLNWEGRYSFRSKIKFYDYGVVSVTLQMPFVGGWQEFIDLSAEVTGNASLEAAVYEMLDRWLKRLHSALTKPSSRRMMEDYAVFAVHQTREGARGKELASRFGAAIAQLLRGEREPLSDTEILEVMSGSLSYQPIDLLVVSWNAAFVFDTPAGMEATTEILEFANSQLLEFRYYDHVLDAELEAVRDEVQTQRTATRLLVSYRYRKTARRLSELYLDISDLTEKSENTLKFFGDLFASRAYKLAAQKLGLNEWKTLVARKLQSAEVLYRSLIDEVSTLQMQFMELAIVLILIFELILNIPL
jgi:hypothetical protein